jgi:hypothetical protein
MLGLPHSFYTEKEKEAYKNARESILGNGLSEKNPNGTNNDKYIAGLAKLLNELKSKNNIYYGWRNLKAIKQDVIDALLNFNIKNQSYIDNQKRKKATDTAYYIHFGPNDRINYSDGTHKTKKEHLAVYDKNIEEPNNEINQNKRALLELNKSEVKNYDNIEQQMWFVKTDLVNLLKQNLDYCKEVINQTHSNYIMFKQKSTSNQMDYYNTRLRYLSNQIVIMRDDYKNY